jgi:hypothetical protein
MPAAGSIQIEEPLFTMSDDEVQAGSTPSVSLSRASSDTASHGGAESIVVEDDDALRADTI